MLKTNCLPVTVIQKQQQDIEHQNTIANNNKFELKFIQDLDNATIIKQPMQQQVLKCQVKLSSIQTNKQLSNSIDMISKDDEQLNLRFVRPSVGFVANYSSATKVLLANVSFSIEWLKDEKSIHLIYPSEYISMNDSFINTTANNFHAQINKKRKIEIKSSLNELQLKFTSRLKISKLNWQDSGNIKCLAKASFVVIQQTNTSKQVEVYLESSHANLVVLPNNNSINANTKVGKFSTNDEHTLSSFSIYFPFH